MEGSVVRSIINSVIAAVNAGGGGDTVQSLTTGADPVEINPEADRVILTTSSTKGSEVATLDVPGSPSGAFGRVMTVVAILTSPDDEPEIDGTHLENGAWLDDAKWRE